jgi:hypothetical protein
LALVTFHNPTPVARRVNPVTAGCQVLPGPLVPANRTVTLATLIGQTWAFADPASGRLVGSTTISAGQRDAWVY